MPDDIIRESNGHFAKGGPGGPGRPRNTITRGAMALDAMGSEIGEKIFQMVVDKALGGDLKAAEMLMSRVWPVRRGRPLEIDARSVRTLPDLVPALSTVTNAVLSGELTPQEGRDVSSLINLQCRAIEAIDIQHQIEELKDAYKDKNKVEESFFGPYTAERATVFDAFSGGGEEEKD